jgi:hypothetical protein
MQPVLRLKRLSDSELLALVIRLAALHGEHHKWDVHMTEENMRDFLSVSLSREGPDSMITPRAIIRDFVTVLDLLLTNPDKSFTEIVGTVERSTVSSSVDEATEEEKKPSTPPQKPKITLDDIQF